LLPSLSVLIPNWNGVALLPTCLASVAALDYPADRIETIVVDDGSTDGSTNLIAEQHPSVRLVVHDENLGFAAACNTGARAATSECVAFLNTDMRVEPGWARSLAAAYDPGRGYVCVAGVILDWDGAYIDFAGGWTSFHGYVGHEDYGKPVTDVRIVDGRDLLFACGGSMLVQRDVFLETGGFDPAYFAFFEDVDFGWRLWLFGHKVRLAANARSFHRHHGTVSALALDQRERLYERNALLTLLKNLDRDNLGRLLAPSLFLLVKRALLDERAPVYGGETGGPSSSPLRAVDDVLRDLPGVLERRREVQGRRLRGDQDIFALFGRPFTPLLVEESYVNASRQLRALFDVDALFAPPPSRPRRILRQARTTLGR
jgi:GT2 family glycosyltransferase